MIQELFGQTLSPKMPIECEVTNLALDVAKPYALVVPYTTFELEFSSVVQVMVEVFCPGVPEEIDESTGAVLSTVNATADDVARLPDVSRATATIDLEPLEVAVLSHVIEYGDEVSSEPMMAPFTLKVTPATATLSEAVAVSATFELETVLPFEGAVTETVGAVVSGTVAVVNVWSDETARLPEASLERTR
jgi:hypothetical protein